MDAARARKLADRISQIVAEMLERRIKDPRLGFATVTEARLTNDLREATVYYTVLGTDAERAETAIALASATGIIRSEVGRQLGLRHTPSLAFVADVLPDTAQRIEELVTQARDADAELAQKAYDVLNPHPLATLADKISLKTNPGDMQIAKSYINCTEDTSLPHHYPWHPRLSQKLGLFRLVQVPGSHELCFSNPKLLAQAIMNAGRD